MLRAWLVLAVGVCTGFAAVSSFLVVFFAFTGDWGPVFLCWAAAAVLFTASRLGYRQLYWPPPPRDLPLYLSQETR